MLTWMFAIMPQLVPLGVLAKKPRDSGSTKVLKEHAARKDAPGI
jgi:hypothetical protein